MSRHHDNHRATTWRRARYTDIARRVADLHSRQARADDAAAATLRDGHPTGHNEPVSGGDRSDPTLSAVMARTRVVEHLDVIDQALATISTALDEIHNAQSRIVAPTIPPKDQPGRSGVVTCLACAGPITCVAEDRPRGGYCPACYQAWHRAGRPDRPAFERTRPHHSTTGGEQ